MRVVTYKEIIPVEKHARFRVLFYFSILKGD